MEAIEIVNKIKENFPDEVLKIKEFREQVSVTLKKNKILEISKFLCAEPGLDLNFLRDICGVDYLGKQEPRFEVVYHLYSIRYKHSIRLKAQVSEDDCSIQSVTSVWKGAGWHERECYDMYGIVFTGHPDLRRILMPEDWEGHPLRKDYHVKGPAKEWAGFLEVLDRAKRFKEFEWHG